MKERIETQETETRKEYTAMSLWQRVISLALALVMVFGMLPTMSVSSVTVSNGSGITTVVDPETLTRPGTIYGDSTINTGKVTVGKSVSNTDITVNGQQIALSGLNNFLVTISQSAQVMGLTTQMSVPVDVVFVLDTSNSMDNDDKIEETVTAANAAIASLMAANEHNRVAVVAFSGTGGGGTSGGAAANILTQLGHYTGDAATNHIQWVTSSGSTSGRDRTYIQGRGENAGRRRGTSTGTNIHAGVALGGSILAEATDISVEISGKTITRIPFLVVMSDGQPSYSAGGSWYDPTLTEQLGSLSNTAGNGFLPALTAAYYKGLITEHYFPNNASETNRCYIYSMGLGLSNLGGNNVDLAEITIDPTNADNTNVFYNTFEGYWNSYKSGTAFDVSVGGGSYTVTAESIKATSKYVLGTGLGYTGSYKFNDAYYEASTASAMHEAFMKVIAAISAKAMSVPTKVTSGDHNFDGYVTFTDPIGSYMEVKDMKGIVADGYFYQGVTFAQKMKAYGTADADPVFDELMHKVLKTRMGLSAADDRFASEAELDAFIHNLLIAARDSANQANYTSATNYDNSIVWWGNAYNSGEEDEHVQMIGFADNDSIAYIEEQVAAGNVPTGADYVCRSYFFYGEAGGANANPDREYLYFMVRIQRELTYPYNQTVVISAPASLLSMETVMITESIDANGNTVYTAEVRHEDPARVVYEVGLQDGITAENVSLLVSDGYANQKVNGIGSVNYDAATGTYNFFTNEWDRTQSLDSHHRGMAKATFDAAADNPFYTYQQDTLLVDASGNAVTSDPRGMTVYYVREYYEWSDSGVDGTYTATKKTALIEVDVPADASLVESGGKWYIPKGTYTAATLVVNGDDTEKTENTTGTSAIVAHPHRTGDSSNSHYTVLLGNNGMLSLVSDPYEPVKTSSVNLPEGATTIVDNEGKPVLVGDVLTYTIEVKNILPYAQDITVKDYVPLGTQFVAGSAGVGTGATGHTADASIVPDSNNVLTWVLEDVPAGETRYVSFQVVVTTAALSQNVVSGNITNTATVQIGNNPSITTNTTTNPPYGKTVTGANGQNVDGEHGFKVGDILVYHIRLHNTAVDSNGNYIAADATVTDKVPAGTTFLSADNGGTYNASTGVVTWSFEDMAPNTSKVVSFQVQINASAQVENAGDSEIYLPNTATIVVGNDPAITLTTNTTENWADVGDMVISKLVAQGGDQTKTFTINLTESTGILRGVYAMTGGSSATVEFVDGKASVAVKHGQTLTIKGLPAGVIISVEEDVSALPGWTPTYNTQSVTIVKGAATAVSSVSVTNTYTLQPLTVTVKGVKNMSGAALSGSITFGFVALPDSGNPVVGDPLAGEVTVSGNGAFEFTMSAKTFTKPGVYKYTISEIDGGIQGVTYDGTEYVLVINVTDNGDGTMSAAATLNGSTFDLNSGKISFSNTYVPEDTQLVISADKALSGRDLVAGEFHFQITDGTNTYYGINDANGNIVFESIAYTTAGTYTYVMSEVKPDPVAEGVSYDTKTYTIQVVVSDVNGQLVPTVTVDGVSKAVVDSVVDTGVTFVNTFTPNDVPLTLVASKTLKVYDVATGTYKDVAPTAGQFRFQIVEKGTDHVVATGTNAADGTITFDTIFFSAEMLKDVAADASGTKTGTFTYVISEVIPTVVKDPNMLYDLVGREVVVTLTYTADGKLTVSVGGDTDGTVDLTGEANFINYGNPDSVSVTPTGNKTTTGHNLPAGLSFSFKVVPVDGTEDAATGTSDATVGGTDSETDHITFTSMVYTHEHLGDAASKTYSYWIMESNAGAGDNGVTYDTTRYLYQVTLTRDAYGRLVAAEQYFALAAGGNAENAADYTVDVTSVGISFTNTYDAKAHINLTANKTLTGRVPGLAAGEFDFVLHRLDATGKLVPGSEITGYNDASGVIHFATLNYSNAMLSDAYKHADGAFYFSYLMQEIKPEGVAVPGVTYDGALYVVTIKVTQTASGMTAELANVSHAAVNGDVYSPGTSVSGFTAAGSTAVTFTNVYQAVEGDVVKYQIKKELNGRDIRPGEFEFGLFLNGVLEDVATNDENGIVTFERLIPATAAKHAGVYKMVIKELAGSLSGVTYSTQEYTIYVKVVDNGTGKIEATVHLTEDGPALPEDATGMVDLTDTFVFVNTYEPHDTTYTPEAEKVLTGRDLVAGEFSFQAQLISLNGTAVTDGAIFKGVNTASGNVIFDAIPYTDAGTYIYRISEVAGSHSGVAYDKTVYYLKVQVTDDGHGHLKAEAAYYSDEACTTSVQKAVFHNSYTPADVRIELEAEKELTGRPMADKEFSFVVRKDDINGKIVATGSNGADGKILFSGFDITAADMAGAKTKDFTFVVVESDNAIPGVTVDKTVYTVVVTVTDDGTGALSAQIRYPNDQPIVFKNSYVPADVKLPLVAFKTLSGKNLLSGEYTFELKDASGKLLQSVTNDASGAIRFEDLVFTAADMVDGNGKRVYTKTFTYTLTEKNEGKAGVSYDAAVYTITVTVTDDLQGNLSITASYADADGAVELLQFVNSYTPTAIDVELEGTKTVVDAEGNVLDKSKYPLSGFQFQVFDADGKFVTDAVSDSEGNIKFTGFKFTAAGEYRFLISEKPTSKPGYTIDPTVWCVHITIGYNADSGKLYEASEYIHVAPESHEDVMALVSEDLTFTNVYDPADVELILKGTKELDGRELKDHEFTFYMVDEATGLREAETRNHANGEFTFRLNYTKAGTYTYLVKEAGGGEVIGGVTYDDTVYRVSVEVTDDLAGKLQAAATVYDMDGNKVKGIVFENRYNVAGEASVKLEGSKAYNGSLVDGLFTFELYKTDASFAITGAAVKTAVNKGSQFSFNLGYDVTQIGTHYYVVMEKNAGLTVGGITYSSAKYYVTVVVSDNGQGGISATATISDGSKNVASMDFANTYLGTGSLTVTKEILHSLGTDHVIPAGQVFTVRVKLSGPGTAGVEFPVQHSAGTITSITTDAQGEFTLTLSHNEQITVLGLPGGTVATVTELEPAKGYTPAYLEDDVLGDGTVTIVKDTNVSVTVENTYTPDRVYPVNVVLSGTKVMITDAGGWHGAKFEFYLQKWNGTGWETIATAYADEQSPTFNFDAALSAEKFETAGAYYYQVVEKNGGQTVNGVTYDATMHTFGIVVTDKDMDGKLEIDKVVSYHSGKEFGKDANGNWHIEISFTNEYNASGSTLALDVKKELTNTSGSPLVSKAGFQFGLYEDGKLVAASELTDGVGEARFLLHYGHADVGKHTYILKEIVPADANEKMTYSTASYTVVVEVTDNGDGTTSAKILSIDGKTDYETPVFTNVYTPDSTSLAIDFVSKELSGRDLVDGEFTFEVRDASGKTILTGKNNAAGQVIFGDKLYFDKVGTYSYTVVETGTDGNGVTVDKTHYVVHVTVTDVNGQLTASYSVLNVVGNSIVFHNTYDAKDTAYTISGNKVLTGKDLLDGQFSFILVETDKDGNVLAGGISMEVSNGASGGFTFPTITYTEAGTYYYLVKEVNGGEVIGGIAYDATVYRVTVTVTDDLVGQLHATATITDDGGVKKDAVVFVNSYSTEGSASVVLEGNKTYNDHLIDGMFTFELYQTDASFLVSGEALKTAVNAGGKFFFDLSYDASMIGTHYYVVLERNGGEVIGNITYSGAKYFITVEVKDNGVGGIEATATITDGTNAVTVMDFVNIFTPDPADLPLQILVNKFVMNTGEATIGPEGFTFQLKNLADDSIMTAVSNAEGKAMFELLFTKDDVGKVYTYEITEIDDGLENVIYSQEIYTVTIAISLNESNELVATVTCNEEAVEQVVAEFENIYDYTPDPDDTSDPGLLLWTAMLAVSGCGGVITMKTFGKKKEEDE